MHLDNFFFVVASLSSLACGESYAILVLLLIMCIDEVEYRSL